MIVSATCGTANPDQAFCGSCGAKLPSVEIPPPPPAPFSPVGNPEPPSTPPSIAEPQAPKSRPKWLVPVLGAALVGAVVVAIVASKDDSSSSSDKPESTSQVTTKATQPATTELSCPTGQHESPVGTCIADPTTTPKAEEGSRDNPLDSSFLTYGDYDPVNFGFLELVDFATIESSNRFNEEPPPGQVYVRFRVTATYNGTETGSYYDFAFNLGLVGDKGKIYETAFIADSDGTLETLSDQPDVISGGVMEGYLYYLIDSDDTDILVVNENSDGNVFIDITP